MSLTEQQAAAIQARGQVIVSASAGSGKTHVMIERFVALLADGEASVRELLAVTFTNKAAMQMRERARKKLAEAYRTAIGDTRTRLKKQLEDLPLADISTIHAFCGRLVRTYFYLVGADPRFTIVSGDQAEGRALSARALDLAFEQAYEEGGAWFDSLLAAYFRKKKDKRLRGIVLGLYDKVRNTANYVEKLTEQQKRCTHVCNINDISDMHAFLHASENDALFDDERKELGRILSCLAEDFSRQAASIAEKGRALLPFIEEYAPRAVDYLRAVLEAAEAVAGAEDLFAMCALSNRLSLPRTPARSKKDPFETTQVIGQAQELAAQVKSFYKSLGEQAGDWNEELLRVLEGRSRAAALAKLTLLYDAEYTRLKREAGVLDYGDLEHLALAVLNHEEAKKAVKSAYRYIFVDEFQDVNPMQSAILEALTGEQLFLVGDKKQAIYGFRGSRTSFFTQKEGEFKEFGGSLSLDKNFRSASAILEAVNCVFRNVMGDAYTPMEGGDRYGEHRGEVFFHTLEKIEREKASRGVYSVAASEGRRTENVLANKVIALIESECGKRGVLGKQWFDPDADSQGVDEKGAFRDVSFGDIAVLVRKNSGAAGEIVRALTDRGIPVTSSAEVNVCDYFEGRLLIDWLSFLDNGEQDIPLATAMLSAIGGFTERELALIRLKVERTLRLYRLTFRAACRAYLCGYQAGNDPLANKLAAFFDKVEHYRILARVKTASEMLSILLADGLEAQIAAMGGGKYALARVRRLVSESVNAGRIHDFLRRLKDANFEIAFTESGGEGAVRVLTMHASKGLEFPVVILVDLDVNFHGPDRDEIMWTDDFGIAPKSFDFENKVFYETLTRRAAEVCMRRDEVEGERNLLYVAMTRAMYRLHMVFGEEGSEDESFGVDIGYAPERAKKLSDFIPRARMLAYKAPPVEVAEAPIENHMFTYQSNSAVVDEIRAAIKPYAFGAATLLPVKSSATALIHDARQREEKRIYHVHKEEEEETLISDMDAVFSTDIGLAYHAYLEHVRFGKDAKAELARMKAEHLLTEAQIALLDEDHLVAILQIPALAALKERETYREQQFLVMLPASEFYEVDLHDDTDVIFQGAIDLLVKEEDGYLIVDYKFSSRSDEGIKEHYAPQIKLYRRAVAKITGVPAEKVRAVVVNIANGREISF